MRFGNVGYSSSTSGQHRVYLACDKEFFDGYLAERGFTYSEAEGCAFRILGTYDDCMTTFNDVRFLTSHAEKDGKASREALPAAKPATKASGQTRKFSSDAKGRPRQRDANSPTYRYWRDALS